MNDGMIKSCLDARTTNVEENASKNTNCKTDKNTNCKTDKNESFVFTEEMKKTHTILIPMMLEPHFTLLCDVIESDGYKVELLKTNNSNLARTGLKYVHNDICYPAILVIGQFIDALKSGKYDLDKTALLITQTGGGCRASNYINLLRKALKKSGFSNIPVFSLNFSSLDASGFKLSKKSMLKLVFAILYGDFIKGLYNESRSYELIKGKSDEALALAITFIQEKLKKGYTHFNRNLKSVLNIFNKVDKSNVNKVKVGIVGEIYLKYSPLGNNNLEDFLIKEGAEPIVSGLLDFILYCIYNSFYDEKAYNMKVKFKWLMKLACKYLIHKQKQMANIIEKNSAFTKNHIFTELINSTEDVISKEVKMGEGWLLSAEMVCHIKHGISNVVVAQPFGCLPNHIVAKGVLGKIKEKFSSSNIVAIDYDPGACIINQENRLKLMLMNAKENINENISENINESANNKEISEKEAIVENAVEKTA